MGVQQLLWVGLVAALLVACGVPSAGGGESHGEGVVVTETSVGPTVPERMADEDERVIAEYFVRLAPGTEALVILEVLAEHGPTIVHDLGRDRYLIRLSSDPGPAALAESIQPPILGISPNRVYQNPRPAEK